jgi:hypothetical protein
LHATLVHHGVPGGGLTVTQKLTRRDKRVWAGQQSMSGPAVRAAVKLPMGALVTATLACSLAAAAVLIVADDRRWPTSMAFLGAAAAFWVCLFDPRDRDADVATIETRMRRLVDGAPTATDRPA